MHLIAATVLAKALDPLTKPHFFPDRPLSFTSLPAAFLASGLRRKEAAAGNLTQVVSEHQQDGGSAIELDCHDSTSRKLTGNSTAAAVLCLEAFWAA